MVECVSLLTRMRVGMEYLEKMLTSSKDKGISEFLVVSHCIVFFLLTLLVSCASPTTSITSLLVNIANSSMTLEAP